MGDQWNNLNTLIRISYFLQWQNGDKYQIVRETYLKTVTCLKFQSVCNLTREAAAVSPYWRTTQDSWVRNKGLWYSLLSRKKGSRSASAAHALSPVQEEEQLSRCCTQGSPVSQMRKLRASSASHAKLLTGLLAWLAFAPRKTLPLLCRTANKSALCPRKEVFFSSKDVCYKIILENILQNKGAETFKTHKDLIASQHWRPYKCIHTMWDRVVRANHFSEGYSIKWEKYLWSTMTYKITHTHTQRERESKPNYIWYCFSISR